MHCFGVCWFICVQLRIGLPCPHSITFGLVDMTGQTQQYGGWQCHIQLTVVIYVPCGVPLGLLCLSVFFAVHPDLVGFGLS